MKPHRHALWIGLCAVLTLAVSLVFLSPAYARYTNTDFAVVQYGYTGTAPLGQTMSAQCDVYDFGAYYRGVNESAFSHTVRITAPTALEGVLRFAWDEETRSQRDMAVHIDSRYYTAIQSSGYTDYTVSAANGNLQVPFSLIFATPDVARVATLDVSWYPEDSDEPTLFARYLLTVAAAEQGTSVPAFASEDTAFFADGLLQVAVTTPSAYDGVWLAPTDGAFAANTRYFTSAYPDGVTLLRDTAIYVSRSADEARLVLDLSAQLTDGDALSLSVGVSDSLCSTLSCAPLADAAPLTVSLSDSAGVLSTSAPLVVTLTDTATFRDSDWSSVGDDTDLTYTVYRRVGDTLQPVKGDSLTVTAARSSSGGTLTLTTDGTVTAGTYVLVITQYYRDYPVLETPIWFFIDYR